VDGNVYRVLARYFGVDLPINSPSGAKYFKELAREVMDAQHIRDYNQGIMEFGAIQCAPKKPYCLSCPLNEGCVALKENKVDRLPVKNNKTKVRIRHFNYLVYLDGRGNTILEQRKGKGIWQNLYQFPLVESEKEIHPDEMEHHLTNERGLDAMESYNLYNPEPIVHKLSHQHLYTKFWIVKTSNILEKGTAWEEATKFPVPVLIADFIRTLKI